MGPMSNGRTVDLDTTDVVCPRCRAEVGESCVKQDGTPSSRSHSERVEFRDYFIEKATGDGSTARWWRWKLRNEGPSRPPMPHGTLAAYERHKRAHEEPCEECRVAARAHWKQRHAT